MTLIEWLVSIVIVLGILMIIVFIPLTMISGFTLTSTSGEHTGYVTATQQTGIIWKTWDVYFKTNTTSTQEDEYCVADSNLVSELQADQQNSKHITIQFAEGMWMMPLWKCSGSDSAIITGIK